MIPRWANLNESDRVAYRVVLAFLLGRLEERATVDWALRIQPGDRVKRAALLDLIDSPDGNKIGEPWLSAWRLIEESWDSPVVEDGAATRAYYVPQRLQAGDRSRVLIAEINKLVAPTLTAQPFTDWELRSRNIPKHPRSWEHLFSARLTSGEIVDPQVLGLPVVKDVKFLAELANALDAAVVRGLDIARRIGWDGERHLWQLGQINRVYYVPRGERSADEHEPDEFHRGLVPSVKLLHFVVSRLAELDTRIAINFVHRWRILRSPIHTRLWAALSRDARITPANEVATFLLSLDDWQFWNQSGYPEIAELRATRFSEFKPSDQAAIAARLRKRPPRSQWPRKAETDHVKSARLYWALRELRRIEISGSALPEADHKWLNAQAGQFPDLIKMSRIDEGFIGTHKAHFVSPTPDIQYDSLVGEERLKSLESALSSRRGGWEDDPAERASEWIRQKENALKVITDFESNLNDNGAFPRVWERLGWTHSPAPQPDEGQTERNLPMETARVLSLLVKLEDATICQAIEGISHWFSVWEKRVVVLPEVQTIWLRLWPIAVEATNKKQPVDDQSDLQTVARSSDDAEPMDLDTLNTPAGKLVGVFLASCPTIDGSDRPFETYDTLRTMRDTIIAATGRAGLIVKHRLIESLPYFLRADPIWTQEHLIAPLISENVESLALWRAIARQTRFSEVLKIIGAPMVERATDQRLGRDTRRSLVFSLVVECLYAFRDHRAPAVPHSSIQQMIRSIDDEVRAFGASAIKQFVLEVSSKGAINLLADSREKLFRSAAKPFLQQVWPQERSLSTPGISRALADLPATAQDAFAEAVDTIERFLVPFECWSMIDYGLYGEEDGKPKLLRVDNEEKANAFMRLLDRTIGDTETSIIPMDLGDALDQVRKIAPNLVETQIFRRLATAARRG